GVNVRDALGHVLLNLLARAGCRGLLQFLARRCVSASHGLCGLSCLYVEFDRCLARALAGASVRARALPAHRQSLAMAHAAVAAEVHETLDRHRDLTAQIALDGEAGDALADAVKLGVGEVLDLARGLDHGGGANDLPGRSA